MVRETSLDEAIKRIRGGERDVLNIDGKDVGIISAEDLQSIIELEERVDLDKLRDALEHPTGDFPFLKDVGGNPS